MRLSLCFDEEKETARRFKQNQNDLPKRFVMRLKLFSPSSLIVLVFLKDITEFFFGLLLLMPCCLFSLSARGNLHTCAQPPDIFYRQSLLNPYLGSQIRFCFLEPVIFLHRTPIAQRHGTETHVRFITRLFISWNIYVCIFSLWRSYISFVTS